MSSVHMNFPGSPRKSYVPHASFWDFLPPLQNDENVQKRLYCTDPVECPAHCWEGGGHLHFKSNGLLLRTHQVEGSLSQFYFKKRVSLGERSKKGSLGVKFAPRSGQFSYTILTTFYCSLHFVYQNKMIFARKFCSKSKNRGLKLYIEGTFGDKPT